MFSPDLLSELQIYISCRLLTFFYLNFLWYWILNLSKIELMILASHLEFTCSFFNLFQFQKIMPISISIHLYATNKFATLLYLSPSLLVLFFYC